MNPRDQITTAVRELLARSLTVTEHEVVRLKPSKRTTAIHEAGHAVAFTRLWPVGRYGGPLTIVPKDNTTGRHYAEELWFPATEDPDESAAQDEELANEAIYCCAGYAAVLVAGYSEAVAVAGFDSDFDQAEGCGSVSLAVSKQRAVELMTRPENVVAVTRLAKELLARGAIGEDDVDILIDVADGKMTEEQYLRYAYFGARTFERERPRWRVRQNSRRVGRH